MEGQAWYEQVGEDPNASADQLTSPPQEQPKHSEDEDDDIGKDYEEVEDILDDDIWKDVQRTHPGYHFFTQQTYVRMHRILYIYGKLNSGVSYVQGMNEILAPIMYVFGAYPGSDESTFEADSFFCFASLMSEVRDLFIRSLDGETSGLHGQIKSLEMMIARHDSRVAKHLKELDVHTQFFAVRWLTTLLTREFELPDALRLWDSMLSSPKRFHFVCCCCTAMITTKHDFLLANDFPTCLKSLQATCTTPVDLVVREAERICKKELSGKKSSWVSREAASNVEMIAMDLFRAAARAARTVVEEAKLVVDEIKQHPNLPLTVHPSKSTAKPNVVTMARHPSSQSPVNLDAEETDDDNDEKFAKGEPDLPKLTVTPPDSSKCLSALEPPRTTSPSTTSSTSAGEAKGDEQEVELFPATISKREERVESLDNPLVN
jgi:hypothetical protein